MAVIFRRKGQPERRLAGMGFIPEERNGHAAVPSMSLADNALLTNHSLAGVVRGGVLDLVGMRAESRSDCSGF
jgi:simple sugar transport system ATP-binding protein